MKKERLYDQLVDAIKKDEYSRMKDLMDGYTPAKLRVAYKVIEDIEGYEAACAVRRGEYSRIGRWMGIV